MTGQEFHEIELRGCTEEPLIKYLKALGIFRIVHKQKDKSVKGYWKNGYFCMKTVLSPEELEKFFLEEFEPSPFFGPWGARSGFWDGEIGAKNSIDELLNAKNPRLENFKIGYELIRSINLQEEINEKPADKKYHYVSLLRSTVDEPLREWIDTCYVIDQNEIKDMLLLGTGGNEGSASYFKSYLHALEACFVGTIQGNKMNDTPHNYLLDSLWGINESKKCDSAGDKGINYGQFDPSSTNFGLSNPWDLVFCLEGSHFFSGSATNRYNSSVERKYSFPFIVNSSISGNNISKNERFKSKKSKKYVKFSKEFWTPIWHSPSRFEEIRYVFAEGKVDFGKRSVNSGVDFSLAISSLGVDRGISSFNRYGRFERNGENNFAIPLGKFKVKRLDNIDIINDFYFWLNDLKVIASDKNKPDKYRSHLKAIEDSIFRFAKYGGATNQQNILIELGKAELSFSSSCPAELKPLQSLSPKWISACDDGSCEYRIACSLASICNQEIGHVREQLEPVKLENHEYVWKERKPLTWNSSNLTLSLIGILKRRLIEQNKNNTGNPLESGIRINSDDVIQFLEGNVDDLKIADLFFELSTLNCKWDKQWLPLQDKANEHHQNYSKCYNAYALLKLVFPDGPYEMNAGKLFVKRNNHNPDTAFVVKANPEILSLFSTHPDKAIETASRRLRTHGLIPLGTMRNRGTSIEFNLSMNARDRILAALLIPIYDYNSLANAVLRIDSTLMEIETTTHNTEVLT